MKDIIFDHDINLLFYGESNEFIISKEQIYFNTDFYAFIEYDTNQYKEFLNSMKLNINCQFNYYLKNGLATLLFYNGHLCYTIYDDDFFKPIKCAKIQVTPEFLEQQTNISCETSFGEIILK